MVDLGASEESARSERGMKGSATKFVEVSFRMREMLGKRTFERWRYRTGGSAQNAYQITTNGLERDLEYEARLLRAWPHLGRQNVTGQCYAQSSRSLDGWLLQTRSTFKSKLELKRSGIRVGFRIYGLEQGTSEGSPSGATSHRKVSRGMNYAGLRGMIDTGH